LDDYEVDVKIESQTRESLRKFLSSQGQINLEKNVSELMDFNGGILSRFEYFNKYLRNFHKSKLLISGCAIGSELLAAKRYGFSEIIGTEVSTELVRIANERLGKYKNFRIDYYDGVTLPYSNNSFSMVYSGHVIEHTTNPSEYLKEHLRVLQNNGLMFIEFPNRYWLTELHTGLFSFEYMPLSIRNLILKKLASRNSLYQSILSGLKPISIWQVRYYCWRSGYNANILNINRPAPGFIRMILSKT